MGGKLTYVMYLIHLMVYTVWISDAENPTYYTEWSELLLVLGVWTIMGSLGLVLWFVMERPLANLVTLCLKWIAGGGHSAKREQHREEALLADDRVASHCNQSLHSGTRQVLLREGVLDGSVYLPNSEESRSMVANSRTVHTVNS